jgi:hypothetical protein
VGKSNAWKENGSDLMPIHDFSPPKSWDAEKIRAEKNIIVSEVASTLRDTKTAHCGWLKIFSSLPKGMRKIIFHEISLGNSIVSIGKSEWPNPQSIVVNLENRFQEKSRNLVATAKWRLLNDPHYWREEISEVEGESEHLIIT